MLSDQNNQKLIDKHWQNYQEALKKQMSRNVILPEITEYRFWLEEWRVSLFAQPMKTSISISEKKMQTFWEEINKTLKNLS